jgi:hypothetical protein
MYEIAAIITIIALALVITSVTAYDLLGRPGAQGLSITTGTFIQQPVVDVIVPSLFRSGSTGGINAPLNLTQGETISLPVTVYSVAAINVTAEFRITPLSLSQTATSSLANSSSIISWSFAPGSFQVEPNGKANTTLKLDVPYLMPLGTYSAVISAANTDNSSQIWGDILQINITK